MRVGADGACAAACEASSTVWVWSSASKECYCKPHGVFLDVKKPGTVSGCKEHAADCAVGCGECANEPISKGDALMETLKGRLVL